MIVGGANPVSSVSTCAPTACPESLIPSIARRIFSIRWIGSVIPTGSGAHIAATWLPSAPRSTSARTDTGTIAFSTTLVGVVAVQAHVAPERAGDGRQHDVVDGPAERVLDRLELGSGRRAPR